MNAPRPRAWVTGAVGLIGGLIARNPPPDFEVVGLERSKLDLTDFAAVERRFMADRPSLIFHCAAMSKSPECQAHPAEARKINVDATAHLGALSADATLVFFSSDLVFDGRKGNYVETDAVNPLSVYGETKAAAEQVVLRHRRGLVIRTSLNSGSLPSAYNMQMRQAWKDGRELGLFTDEYRSPIAASVTARVAWELALAGATGMYHVAGAAKMSRLEIGRLLAARHPELTARIRPESLKEYKGAPRPADASLNCAKAAALLSFALPALADWLREHPEEEF